MAELKKIWDNTKIIGETMTSEKTKLVVSANIRDGLKYIGIKQWYQKKDGEWKPGIDWVCFASNPYAKGGAPLPDPTQDIIRLIGEARVDIDNMPLYDEANVVYAKPKERK